MNKEEDPTICCLQETQLTCKDTQRLKGERWELIFHINGKQRELYQIKSIFKKLPN
jgi:hypothetical protein